MKLLPYREELQRALDAFNGRLRAGGSDLSFQPSSRMVRGERGELLVSQEGFLAVDGTEVRGAYSLIRQEFDIVGAREPVGFLQIPLSEGIVNPKYRIVGALLIRHFLEQAPLGFALGMGGMLNPLPKMLQASGFRLTPVPFFFRVCRPVPFLKNLVPLKENRKVGPLLGLPGVPELATPAIHAWQAWRGRGGPSLAGVEIDEHGEFPPELDVIQEAVRGEHSWIAVRSQRHMNAFFSTADKRFHRLLVRRNGMVIGWALTGDSQMTDHNYFGAMRLGSVIDCLARPGCEADVAQAATSTLRERGVDLIVSNQLARRWRHAFALCGYLTHRSNFALATSPQLTKRIEAVDAGFVRVHINRGDGDGPYNL